MANAGRMKHRISPAKKLLDPFDISKEDALKIKTGEMFTKSQGTAISILATDFKGVD